MAYDKLQTKFKAMIDDNAMSWYQIIVVGICFVLNMSDGIDVLVVSFSSSEIIREWGLSKTEMGYIFSAGLTGMTLGCFFLAPWADKIGRKKVFLGSLVLISSGMLLASVCTTYPQLLALRLLTGLGIGGLLPAMAAIASEFSNEKYKDFNVGLVQAGWPVGAIGAGFFCAWAIPQWGWRPAFFTAGCISVIMLVLVFFYMSDSLAFLVKKQSPGAHTKINTILKKMGRDGIDYLPAKPATAEPAPARTLFTPEFKNATIKLWVAAFFGFMTLYSLMSWVPNIAKDAGLPFEMATYVGIALNVGAAFGTTILGVIAAKLGLKKTVLSFMVLAFGVMLIYGNTSPDLVMIFVLVFLIGTFVQGGFNGLWPTVSRVYPTEIRTTGVGFAFGIGRLGAILGPTLFGVISDAGWSVPVLFSLFSLPLLISGISVWSVRSKNLND